jgi:protoporphyrinogen oxidase
MAASFDFAGVPIERYYHFHCLSDTAFFTLLDELDLQHLMRWRCTEMGFFIDGRLHRWGSAGSVLKLRRLPLLSRLRYLLHAARCLTLRDWHHLDGLTATVWLKRWLGTKGYELLWSKLFAYKFYEHTDTLSAAWIWSRIRRIGRSRRWMKETLGYLEGGSERWIGAIASHICDHGGEIRLNCPVKAILGGSVRGDAGHGGCSTSLSTPKGTESFDAVVSTVPLPLVAPMLRSGGQDPTVIAAYEAQRSVACACVVLQTAQPITANFWTNVNDARFKIPGIIEVSNLRPLSPHITYVPFYMPADHPDYARSNQAFIDASIACLKAINPALRDADILASQCHRYRYAQPVCGTHFLESLPPLQALSRVWIADTTAYYPEDRGISESVGFGRDLARTVAAALSVGGRPG